MLCDEVSRVCEYRAQLKALEAKRGEGIDTP